MSVSDADEAAVKERAKGRSADPSASPERLRLAVHDLPEPGERKSPVVLVSLLVLMTGGLGYCGWLLFQEQQQSEIQRRGKTSVERTLQEERKRSAVQISSLEQTKTDQEQRLSEAGVEVLELKATLAAAQARLETLEAERAQLDVLMAEYKDVAQQFRSMVDSGKLTINFRRGRMIVELPAAVLFASGSAELSAEGSAALKEVASILHKVPGKRFIVAGHTDNVPLSKTQTEFRSNWALSAARAVMVTETLLNAGLQPGDLVAAGYGEYDPIASNANPAGRQKNRRIEIVLEPQVAALPKGLKEKGAQPAHEKQQR